jgi:hypothetical protein
MSEDRAVSAGRLAAAIDSSDEGIELFRRAAMIAAALDMALDATILEDQNLAHMADLPFGKTFEFSTGLTKTFDRNVLVDVARSHARRIRETHAELTRQFRISCTTNSTSSVSTASTILRLSTLNRYVLTRGLSHATEYLPRRRPKARDGSVLVALTNGTETLETDLRIGLAAANALNCKPIIFASRQLETPLMALLNTLKAGSGGASPLVEFTDSIESSDLCAMAGRHNAGLIVLPVELTGGSEAEFRSFLQQVGCPLLLVNRKGG